MNPLDWRGPEFLLFYGAFAAAFQIPEPASWAMMSLSGLGALAIRTGRLSDQSERASIAGAD